MSGRLLVTGAQGFLGRSVVRHFSEHGWVVNGLGHGGGAASSEVPLAAWHTADITLDALVTYAGEPDLIVHCAGSGSVPFSVAHPFQDYARTVTSTAAVLEYIRLHSPATRLVYPSSAAVYGVAAQLPIAETAVLLPASPYGAHKLMAEQLCRSYSASFGLSVAIVRFFSIYGDGLRKQLLWDACSKLAASDPPLFGGTGAELRDWVHSDDAARLIERAAAQASPTCPIANGGSGDPVTVADALRGLFGAWGSNAAPMFSGQVRRGDPPGYQADVSQATAWGWSPRVNFNDGLKRYVAWFRGATT